MMETVNKMRKELIGAKKGTAPEKEEENEEDDGDENDNADVSENKQK